MASGGVVAFWDGGDGEVTRERGVESYSLVGFF